jgi:hypothetical protein
MPPSHQDTKLHQVFSMEDLILHLLRDEKRKSSGWIDRLTSVHFIKSAGFCVLFLVIDGKKDIKNIDSLW